MSSHSSSPSLALLKPSRLKSLSLLLASTAAPLWAHPGHSHYTLVAPEQPVHWLIEPAHALVWIAVSMAACAGHYLWRQQRRPLKTSASTPDQRA